MESQLKFLELKLYDHTIEIINNFSRIPLETCLDRPSVNQTFHGARLTTTLPCHAQALEEAFLSHFTDVMHNAYRALDALLLA